MRGQIWGHGVCRARVGAAVCRGQSKRGVHAGARVEGNGVAGTRVGSRVLCVGSEWWAGDMQGLEWGKGVMQPQTGRKWVCKSQSGGRGVCRGQSGGRGPI